MFNDTQQQIYEDAWGYIECKLDFYVSRILDIDDDQRRQSALNAFYFCIHTALTLDEKTRNLFYDSKLNPKLIEKINEQIKGNKERVDATTTFFFPADVHSSIREFFSDLHDFLYGQGAKNRIVASVIDPRFFASQNLADRKLKQQELLQEFGRKLYEDCDNWLSNQNQLKRFDKKDMKRFEQGLIEKGVLCERDELEVETASSSVDKWRNLRAGM